MDRRPQEADNGAPRAMDSFRGEDGVHARGRRGRLLLRELARGGGGAAGLGRPSEGHGQQEAPGEVARRHAALASDSLGDCAQGKGEVWQAAGPHKDMA
eukprot:9481864-Lingulodinium_polyedra.AAC.1